MASEWLKSHGTDRALAPATTRSYYTAFSGTLTGAGSLAGAELDIVNAGSAFKVGFGANNKNLNFGASSCFDWTVVSNPSSGGQLPYSGRGDFNLDFVVCPPDNEFAGLGIHVTTNDPANHPAMIFDSSNPTGGDNDLGTLNQDFGGSGVGSRGATGTAGENAVPLGKVLIISESGDQSDPDDNAGGGEIIFAFDSPVFIGTANILDIDEGWGGSLKAFDASNTPLVEVAMQDLGNNSVQTVVLNVANVSKLKVWFPGSGAIARLEVCGPGGGGPVKLKQNGEVIGTMTTDSSGEYTFSDLEAGEYTVKVTSSTLPSGITVPTYDLDGVGTADQAILTLGGGQHRDDADLGYQEESSSPCSYCEHYSGHLEGSGTYQWQPDGNYYWAGAGTHESWLTFSGDFDLYLYKWNGSNWSVVDSSSNNGTSDEHVQYNGGSGYYIWLVQSYSGSGDYSLYLDRP